MEHGQPIDIDAIEKQYGIADPRQQQDSEDPPPVIERESTEDVAFWPSKWSDFKSLKKLSDYLKKHPNCRLMTTEKGKINLHFVTGIKKDNRKQRNQAAKALDLLFDALEDLHYCLDHGLLKLPVRKYDR